MTLRVALISTPFVSVPPKGYGGTELVVADLAKALRAQGTDVVVYASEPLMEQIRKDLSLEQAMNVATLPGIIRRPLSCPCSCMYSRKTV